MKKERLEFDSGTFNEKRALSSQVPVPLFSCPTNERSCFRVSGIHGAGRIKLRKSINLPPPQKKERIEKLTKTFSKFLPVNLGFYKQWKKWKTVGSILLKFCCICLFNYLFINVYTNTPSSCMCHSSLVPLHDCGDQRSACRSQFPLLPFSTMWVLEIKLKSSGLVARAFTHWAISLAWQYPFYK